MVMNKSTSFQPVSGLVFSGRPPRSFPPFLVVWGGQTERETPLADFKLHAARFGVCVGLAALVGVLSGVGGKPVKSHIVYRLCNHMVYTLSLIQPGVIVQEIALFECVNSLVQVDAADSELSEHQCDLPRERRLANGDAFPTKPFA